MPRLALAQVTAALALMAGSAAFCLNVPADTLPQQQRNGAAVAILLGSLILPAALTISAARNSQA